MFKLKELFKGFSLRDLALLLIFPTIITLLMFLPEPIRIFMQLNIKNPQWWQFFTSGFIQQNWSPHFLGNILGYFIMVFPVFFLIATRTNKKKYYFYFLTIISLTFPLLGSLFQWYFYPNVFTHLVLLTGSSGIIAGLSGLIPAFWILSLANKIQLRIKIRFALISIVYLPLSFLFIYSALLYNLKIFFCVLVFFILLLFSYRNGILSILLAIGNERKNSIFTTFILILTLTLFLATPSIIFPKLSVLSNGTTLTDFFVHYLGMAYGLIISFYFFIFINKETKPLFFNG